LFESLNVIFVNKALFFMLHLFLDNLPFFLLGDGMEETVFWQDKLAGLCEFSSFYKRQLPLPNVLPASLLYVMTFSVCNRLKEDW